MSLFSKKEKQVEKQIEPEIDIEKDTYEAYLARCAQNEVREIRLAKMHVEEAKKNRKEK